jgi:hypothetical protein
MYTATEYVRGDREVDGFAICRQLLTFSDTPLRIKAAAHLLLSLSDENKIFHGRKAVEYYTDMFDYRLWENYKDRERKLAQAEKFLQHALDSADWEAWDK